MEKPDVELEITRNEKGRVVGLAYKVNNVGEENKRAMEGLSLMSTAVDALFGSEWPEDHSHNVAVDEGAAYKL